MGYDIGPKIGIEGEKAFRKSISNINTHMRTLKTEMVAVASQFDKNDDSQEAYTEKNKVLNKQIDLQKKKLEELRKGLKKSADKYGENDRVTQGWKQAVNKATAELNDMDRKLKKSGKSMDNLGDEMKTTEKRTVDLSGKFSSLGSGLAGMTKGALKGAIGGIAAVGAAATTAVAGIFKFSNDSVKAMNDFQAKTGATKEEMEEFSKVANDIYSNNFGESLEDVAKTMARIKQLTGLTSEELNEASTAALLLRDVFEYEVEESTRAASTLMKTFGIDAERAYELIAIGAQNGADKNGDLLDTINEYSNQYKALGFSEDVFLESLIEGAESGAWSIDKIGDAVKEFNIRSKDLSESSADAFNSLGFNADEMFNEFSQGGDTANMAFQAVMEALQGIDDPLEKNRIGVALFGTQFEDLEAGVVDVLANLDGKIGESEEKVSKMTDVLENMAEIKYDDLGSAIEGLKRSILNGLGGVTDIAKDSVKGIVEGIQNGDWEAVAISFSEGFTGVLEALLPTATTTIATVLNSVIQSIGNLLPQVLPLLVSSLLMLITTIIQVLTDNGPMILQTGLDAILNLGKGILLAIPMIVPIVLELLEILINTMLTESPKIMEALLNTITEYGPVLIETGINALMSLIIGMVEMLPSLIATAIILLMALVNGLIDNLPLIISAAIDIVLALIDGILILLPELIPAAIKAIVTFAQGLIDALPKLIEKLPEIIQTIITVLVDNIPLLITAAYDIIIALAEALITNLPLIIQAAYEIIPAIIEGIIDLIGNLPAVVVNIYEKIKETLTGIDWANLGKDMMGGIVSGIVNAASSIADSVVNAAKNALEAAKEFLGINSPSKVMRDQIGKNIGGGLAVGIKDSTNQVNTAMNILNNKIVAKGSGIFATQKAGKNNTSGNGITSKVEHSGTIRVEGVDKKGELKEVIEITVNNMLRKEQRGYA